MPAPFRTATLSFPVVFNSASLPIAVLPAAAPMVFPIAKYPNAELLGPSE